MKKYLVVLLLALAGCASLAQPAPLNREALMQKVQAALQASAKEQGHDVTIKIADTGGDVTVCEDEEHCMEGPVFDVLIPEAGRECLIAAQPEGKGVAVMSCIELPSQERM